MSAPAVFFFRPAAGPSQEEAAEVRLKPAAEVWDLHDGSNVVCQNCGDQHPEDGQRRRREGAEPWRGQAAGTEEEVPW